MSRINGSTKEKDVLVNFLKMGARRQMAQWKKRMPNVFFGEEVRDGIVIQRLEEMGFELHNE